MNKFPLWKNLLIIVVILFSAVYAVPNLFGEDPAVQISGKKGVEVSQKTSDSVLAALKDAGIPVKASELEKGQLLVRLDSEENQMKAQNIIDGQLGDDYSVAINLAPSTPKVLTAIGANPLKLGLDLRGGVHFLEEIDMKTAMDKSYQQLVQDARSILREEKIRGGSVKAGDESVKVSFAKENDRDAALDAFKRRIQGLVFTEGADNGRYTAELTFSRDRLQELKTMAVDQNINIIRNRVNELGVAEPLVQRQGSDRIVIELPGIQDPARAK